MSEMIGRAYDFIAADYDHLLQRDQGMRAVLWRRYARLFQEGDQILDFCCGTGLDALFLARRGMRVTGLDASPGMIEQLQKKARLDVNAGFTGNITASVGTTEDLKIMPGTDLSRHYFSIRGAEYSFRSGAFFRPCSPLAAA